MNCIYVTLILMTEPLKITFNRANAEAATPMQIAISRLVLSAKALVLTGLQLELQLSEQYFDALSRGQQRGEIQNRDIHAASEIVLGDLCEAALAYAEANGYRKSK